MLSFKYLPYASGFIGLSENAYSKAHVSTNDIITVIAITDALVNIHRCLLPTCFFFQFYEVPECRLNFFCDFTQTSQPFKKNQQDQVEYRST